MATQAHGGGVNINSLNERLSVYVFMTTRGFFVDTIKLFGCQLEIRIYVHYLYLLTLLFIDCGLCRLYTRPYLLTLFFLSISENFSQMYIAATLLYTSFPSRASYGCRSFFIITFMLFSYRCPCMALYVANIFFLIFHCF